MRSRGPLKDLCFSKLGGIPGFTTVLHTYSRGPDPLSYCRLLP